MNNLHGTTCSILCICHTTLGCDLNSRFSKRNIPYTESYDLQNLQYDIQFVSIKIFLHFHPLLFVQLHSFGSY